MKTVIPPKMNPVPLGCLTPEGWLKEQVRLTVSGFFGHVTDISAFLTENNGWLQWQKTLEEFQADSGNDGRGYAPFAWEEQAYWLRGAYKLAVVSRDEKLTAISLRYIRAMLDSAAPDGYFGPVILRAADPDTAIPMPDIWPHMVMADVLKDYYLETGDEKVISVLLGFCRFCLAIPDEVFMPVTREPEAWYALIQTQRVCEMAPVLAWLAEKTGAKEPAALQERFFRVYRTVDPTTIDCHVVNFAQRIKYPATNYPFSGDKKEPEESELRYRKHMEAWGQMPGGLYAADENTRAGKHDPRQGTETCAMSEMVKSFLCIAAIGENPVYGDRTEDIMFNSYPASHTPDYSGLHYLTADNLPELDGQSHDYQNKGMQTRYTPAGYRCCQHNTGAAWPNFLSSMFLTQPGGLTAWVYGPCTLRMKRNGKALTVAEKTGYPFGETIRFEITYPDGTFDFRFRVPGWAKEFSVTVDGISVEAKAENGIVTLAGIGGTRTVTVTFPQETAFRHFAQNNDCVCIDRGPLTYSLRLREQWNCAGRVTDRAGKEWSEWDVRAVSPYNYALDLSKPVSVRTEALHDQPFTPDNAPVVLTAYGRRLPGWGIGEDNTIMPVPASPVMPEGESEELEFVPLGCMRARMSCFPWF